MRRFLAAILALAMMVSLSVVAMADPSDDIGTVKGRMWSFVNGLEPDEDIFLERDINATEDTLLTVRIYIPGSNGYRKYDTFLRDPTDTFEYEFDHFIDRVDLDIGGFYIEQAYSIKPKASNITEGTELKGQLTILGSYAVWSEITNGFSYAGTDTTNYPITMTITSKKDPTPDNPDPDNPNPDNPDPDNPNPDKPNPDDPNPDKPNPDKPDRPDPTPGPVVDDDDDDDSPTDNKANDDKTKDDFDAGENVVLNLTNGSAAIRFDTMDALGASNGSLTIKNGKATITIPGGFGAVNEPGRIYYPFDCDNDFPYSVNVDKTFEYGNDHAYEKVEIGVHGETLPTEATITLNTNLTGTVEVYKYDPSFTGSYKLVTTTNENNGAVTFKSKELGDFVLVQKGKTPTPVIPGDVNSAIAEINAERVKRGLPALQVDSKLMAAAAQRAKEQPISFGHTRPDGSQVNDSLPGEFGITGVWENCGTMPTPGGAIAQWMDDPPHRDILMASAPTKVGVGYCYDPNSPYKNYWVFLATW